MSKKKGCDFKIDSKGKPHCSSNKTGKIDKRCYIPKRNCSVKLDVLSSKPSSAAAVSSEDAKVNVPVSVASEPASHLEQVSAAAEPQPAVEVEYPWVCQCGYTDNTEANCKMCTQSKAISRIFDGYKEQWVCLRCFQINNPAPPGVACSQCGENEVIFSIAGRPARRPVRDCDMDYCRESQINSWCFKHAMNNLIKKHKYFIGEFNGAVEEHNQINVMGICKEKSADILGPDVTLQMANELLFQCGPTVNINISVALAAIEKGGYSYEVIYDPAMGKGNDIELQVNTKINQEFLSNEQLLGLLLRVSISEGDPNTNHFTVIRKEAECPGRFKYIESRDISPEGSAPISGCLDLDMGIGVVNSFLLGESMKYRVHSIVAIYRR